MIQIMIILPIVCGHESTNNNQYLKREAFEFRNGELRKKDASQLKLNH